jgi:hypothetical protein
MRMFRHIFIAALAAVGAAHAEQPPTAVGKLIAQLEPLNDACRGGSGDDPATQKECAQRDQKFNQIKKAGWCLGPDSAPAYQQTWMACAGAARPMTASCPMFKGPAAVVCHDQAMAANAFERYGFDAAALSASHTRAYLQKFGCTPVEASAANQVGWTSDVSLDRRTARSSGWVTVGFVKKAQSDPNVAPWAVATDYLNSACRGVGNRH